jgi:hypothetical protein
LESIAVPSSVWEINAECFANCDSLSTVTFGTGSQLREMEAGAFSHCSRLESIAVPSSVREIDAECFANCDSLSAVTFGTGSQLREMEAGAFSQSSQAQVVLPDGQTVLAKSLCQGWKRPRSRALP